MSKDEALRLALEALEYTGLKWPQVDQAITAIEAALEAKDEPVAWIYKGEQSFDGNKWSDEYELTASKQVALWKGRDAKPLYTTPPQRTWTGLTDAERKEIHDEWRHKVCSTAWGYEQAIEAKLKEKNT